MSEKPKKIEKSIALLEVFPWGTEVDMAELEKTVRAVVRPGLTWGESRVEPHVFGMQKLIISGLVEVDDFSFDDIIAELVKEEEDEGALISDIQVVGFTLV